jgi:hypothetical protein
VFPATSEFTTCLKKLQGDGVKVMLGYVWEGFDRFKEEVLDKNPDPSRENPDLERDLTELLYPHILKALPASLPYFLLHEKKERESAVPGKQPPEPDLSFVLHSNPRITFPMDSKVVERDSVASMTDYVDTVQNKFVRCVYAPFSKEGAMLAVLLVGSVRTLFRSLGAALGCQVSRTAYVKSRSHKTTWHDRPAAACKYRTFRCHHLVMPMTINVTN